MKVLTNSPVAITDGSDGRSPRRRGLGCRRFKSASAVSLPPVHKLWQCFGATFGDSHHHARDDSCHDDRDASAGSGGSTEAELTSSFFYGDQKEIPNHKQQSVRHNRSWHARSPNSDKGRRAVSFSYPDAGVCVDDFVGAAREV
jgi:hypothetical protein